jgi:hypothetical protein
VTGGSSTSPRGRRRTTRILQRVQPELGIALQSALTVFQLAQFIFHRLDLAGHRFQLAFQRVHPAGQIGNRRGGGRRFRRRCGRCSLGGDFRFEESRVTAGKNLALHRAHFRFERTHPAIELANIHRLCRERGGQQHGGSKQNRHETAHKQAPETQRGAGCGAA